MNVSAAVDVYVTGRAARGEITADTAAQLGWRLGGLVDVYDGPVAGLGRAHIAAWQAAVGGQRPASRRSYLSTVRTFCRWAVAEGLLEADPTAGCARVREPRHVPRALSAAAFARLRLVLPDLRAEVIVTLMFAMGLRCVEVARLTWRDYDPVTTTMIVDGKGRDERELPVPPAMVALLAAWAARRPPGGPVIGITPRRISVLVSRWLAAAGIKGHAYDGVSAHALRHTFASDLLDRCDNVRTVQAALGHQSLETTQRYLRDVTLDELRRAMSA